MDVAELRRAIDTIDTFLWPESDEKLTRKRERILRAAIDLFVRLGYRKTSIDEVARQAGVAKGTVYLYYRNKAELVYHALSFEERSYLERMLPIAEMQVAPREGLHEFIVICVRMTRELPLMSSLIQGDHEIAVALQEVDQSLLANTNKLQIDYVLRLLETATAGQVSRKELEARGQVMIDLLFALTTSTTMNAQGMNWDDYVDALADVIVDGVLAPGRSPGNRKAGSKKAPKKQKLGNPQTV